MLRFLLASLALVATACASLPANARDYNVVEPKKIKSAKNLRDGEGALLISIRSQTQSTKTLFVYFVKLNEDGTDSDQYFKFERGAGVPILGSNMIDVKQAVFRLPAGEYRPLAYTFGCLDVPEIGSSCIGPFSPSGGLPTERYARSNPILAVRPDHLTIGGDFIVEYDGVVPEGMTVWEAKKSRSHWQLRWRPIASTVPKRLASLPTIDTPQPGRAFHSRITCDERPDGVKLYIPFEC